MTTLLWLALKLLQWIAWILALPFWFGVALLGMLGVWAYEKADKIDERWKRA